jgi:Tfp pilus assembly major pilin PilA
MKGQGEVAIGLLIILGIVGVIAFIAFGPIYNVWASEMAGKAELAQAQYNRQIAVTEAQAKLESAKSLAAAEVERAKGVAQANQIIGESLKNNEEYLKYLWITDVAGANIDKTIVYIPTETNLPILEATRSLKVGA